MRNEFCYSTFSQKKMWIGQFIAVKMKNWPRIRVLRPRISPETTFRDFWETSNFYFFFLISHIKSLRNMSALRLNSGPRKETKYFAILRQISPDYASPLTPDCEKWRKIAQDGERWHKIAQDGVICQIFATAVCFKIAFVLKLPFFLSGPLRHILSHFINLIHFVF